MLYFSKAFWNQFKFDGAPSSWFMEFIMWAVLVGKIDQLYFSLGLVQIKYSVFDAIPISDSQSTCKKILCSCSTLLNL